MTINCQWMKYLGSKAVNRDESIQSIIKIDAKKIVYRIVFLLRRKNRRRREVITNLSVLKSLLNNDDFILSILASVIGTVQLPKMSVFFGQVSQAKINGKTGVW